MIRLVRRLASSEHGIRCQSRDVEIRIRCVVVDCVVIEGDDCEEFGTFLVTSVGLHHHRESEDKCCTEPPERSSAVDVAFDIPPSGW